MRRRDDSSTARTCVQREWRFARASAAASATAIATAATSALGGWLQSLGGAGKSASSSPASSALRSTRGATADACVRVRVQVVEAALCTPLATLPLLVQ